MMTTDAKQKYQRARIESLDEVARNMGPKNNWVRFYHQRLMRVYRRSIACGLCTAEDSKVWARTAHQSVCPFLSLDPTSSWSATMRSVSVSRIRR